MPSEDQAAVESPLACSVAPFTPAQRERWMALGAQWRASVRETRELPDGYALRIPSDSESIVTVAEWMSLDRLCCPFFTFTLEIEREAGAVWLRLTGTPQAKEFLHQAISRKD